MRNGSENSNSESRFLIGLSGYPEPPSLNISEPFLLGSISPRTLPPQTFWGTVQDDGRPWISGSFTLEMVHPCPPSVPRPLIKGGTTDDGSWHCCGTIRDDTGRRTRSGVEQGKHERTIVPLSPLDLARSWSICLKTSGRRDDAPKHLRIGSDSGVNKHGGSG